MSSTKPAARRGASTPSTAGASAKKCKPAAAVKPTAPRLDQDGNPIERCPRTLDMFDKVAL